MIDELLGIANNLMQDQFGVSLIYVALFTYWQPIQNYVVQYILQHGQPHDCVIIAARMQGLVLEMSCHKFASNVVEKILVYADHDTKQKIISEVLGNEYGSDPVYAMMLDGYGSEYRPESLPLSNFQLKIMLFKQCSIKFKGTSENFCVAVSDHTSSVSQNQRSNPSMSSLVSSNLL